MTHHIYVELNRAEGALIRVLGLAERRGYEPLTVSALPRGATLSLSLSVFSNRPIEQLLRQLEKLFDVQTVELAEPARRSLGVAG